MNFHPYDDNTPEEPQWIKDGFGADFNTFASGATGTWRQEAEPKWPMPGVWFHGDAPPKPVPTLIRRLLPTRDLSLLAGQSGSGKSFVACDLSAAVVTQTPFFGFDVLERAAVIYIAAEGASSIPMRIEAALAARGFSGVAPIVIVSDVPDLANASLRRNLIASKIKPIEARIKEAFGLRVGVVIIDTVGSACTIKDENSAGEMNALCRGLKEIGDAVEGATLPIVHFGKSQETGIRGSSATRGFGESVLSVLGERDETSGTCKNRRLVHTKNRHGAEGPISNFDLIETDVSLGEHSARVPVVSVKGGEVKAGPKRLTRDARHYLSTFERVFAGARLINPFGDDPTRQVMAILREDIRQEFYASWTKDGKPGEPKTATKNRAFNRGEGELTAAGFIATREVNGRDFVWKLDTDTDRDTDRDKTRPL